MTNCPFCGTDNIEFACYLSDGWMECVKCGSRGPYNTLAAVDNPASCKQAEKDWENRFNAGAG